MLEDLKKEMEKCNDIKKMRCVCQEFSNKFNCGINFDYVDDSDVVESYNQIKEVISCLK